MTTLQENIERFKVLEKATNDIKATSESLKAKAEVHKEQYQSSKKDLEVNRGITYTNGKELQEIYLGKLANLNELLTHAEITSGIKKEESVEDSFFAED